MQYGLSAYRTLRLPLLIPSLVEPEQLPRLHPADLGELVPKYLPDHKALLVRGKVEPLHSPRTAESAPHQVDSLLDSFGYRRDDDTYDLSFRYTGSGMNRCSYDPKTKTWRAAGYY